MAFMEFREPNQVKWVGVRPGHNGEQVLEYAIAQNSTPILYTVPAGKVFYLCGYSLNTWDTVGVATLRLVIYDDTPAAWKYLQYLISSANSGQSITKSYWPPLEIPSGYSVRLESAVATATVRGSIHGWVEDA